MLYLDLFYTFAKIGLFTFGGGYAMLPLIQREVVDHKHWATESEILDYYAVGQCTPGIIAVNTATFIGYYKKGVLGGICATLGVIFPSIIIILLIANFLHNFQELALIQHALAGIRIGVCALILQAVVKLCKKGIQDQLGWIIFLLALLASTFHILPTIMIILLAAIMGVCINIITTKKDGK